MTRDLVRKTEELLDTIELSLTNLEFAESEVTRTQSPLWINRMQVARNNLEQAMTELNRRLGRGPWDIRKLRELGFDVRKICRFANSSHTDPTEPLF
jgi:hypothetical protein